MFVTFRYQSIKHLYTKLLFQNFSRNFIKFKILQTILGLKLYEKTIKNKILHVVFQLRDILLKKSFF